MSDEEVIEQVTTDEAIKLLSEHHVNSAKDRVGELENLLDEIAIAFGTKCFWNELPYIAAMYKNKLNEYEKVEFAQ